MKFEHVIYVITLFAGVAMYKYFSEPIGIFWIVEASYYLHKED